MRHIINTLVLLVLFSNLTLGQDRFFDELDAFYQQHVQQGKVDYAAIKAQPATLQALLQQASTLASSRISSEADQAILINTYNLYVIDGIVQEYPVASPQAISNFFDRPVVTIEGKKYSLNQLEKELLLKQTADARLHFALVCAAVGCPQLIAAAYRPGQLSAQLDQQTRFALNDPNFTRVNRDEERVQVSQLFEWYKRDFTQEHSTVLAFINQYREEPVPPYYRLSHYTYDWALNSRQAVIIPQPGTDERTSNLLQFTPSQLFGRGQYEVNVFNNLYSQTSVRNRDGEELSFGTRQSILTTMIQFTTGVSDKKTFNLGADIIVSGGAVGAAGSSGQFQFLGGDAAARDLVISAIGPRIKFQPFKKLPFYSIQSSFLIPLAGDLEGQAGREVFVALNRYQWKNQFFYDLKLSPAFRLFYEFNVNYFIRRNQEETFFIPNFVDLPSTLFVNYFPSAKWNLFVMGQYSGRYGRSTIEEGGRFGLLQWYVQLGGGLKYQITPHIGLELSYGNFVGGRGLEGFEVGAGQITNLGIRFIR